MGLSTNTELIASIQTWSDRNDAGFVAAIPDFITLFETTANEELALRTRYNTQTVTLTLATGGLPVTLPSDFLEAKTFLNITTTPYQIIPVFNATSLYTQVTNPTATGSPKGVTVTGSNAEFAPFADQIYSVKMYYYAKVPALATASTNWLLTNFPNVYLYGSLLAAEAFLGMDPRLKLWGDLYDNAIQKIAGATERGQYGGSPLTVRVDAVV